MYVLFVTFGFTCFWKSSMGGLSNDALIPIIRDKELKINSFVMGFHEYRTIWMPYKNEMLLTRMEPTNKKDKFTVAVIGDQGTIIGHLLTGRDGRFAKTSFYFLRASKYHCCRVQVEGKAIIQGDDKGVKVPCTLLFTGQSEFVDILSHELKNMYVCKQT